MRGDCKRLIAIRLVELDFFTFKVQVLQWSTLMPPAEFAALANPNGRIEEPTLHSQVGEDRRLHAESGTLQRFSCSGKSKSHKCAVNIELIARVVVF